MTAEQIAQWQAEIALWQLYLSEGQALIGLVSLVFLGVYVFKTWQIASETRHAAQATETAARATEQEASGTKAAVEAALRQIEEMRLARETAERSTVRQVEEMARARRLTAEASREELAELARARLAAIRPYVHVGRVTYRPDLMVNLEIELFNFGPGPALLVHGDLRAGWLEFGSSYEKATIPPNRDDYLAMGRMIVRQPPTGDGQSSDALLVLEYKDLDDRAWSTELVLRGSSVPQSNLLNFEVRARTYDVKEIPQFTIAIDRLGAAEQTGL